MTLVHPPRRFDSCLNFRGDDWVDWVAAKVFVAVRHSSAPVLGLSPTTNDGQHKNTTGTYLLGKKKVEEVEEEERTKKKNKGLTTHSETSNTHTRNSPAPRSDP